MSSSTSPAKKTRHSQQDPDSVLAALKSPRKLRTELLGGLVVALALIPEAISFSIIAGVDPSVGLWASVVLAMSIAVLGGRPAMISAATGAIALVVAPVTREHGFDFLIATVLLGGTIQIILSVLGVAKLMRFIPRSVMVGFVNALAILIFMAQLPYLIGPDIPWLVYPLVALSIFIIITLPKMTTAVPAPLVSVLVVTGLVLVFGWNVPNVAGQGELPTSLPRLFFPDVPWTLETLQIIAPYALAFALVGLMESLMTAKLVDDITDTHSNKTREGWGQGASNIITGLFGGMGGCGMIGQTMINVKESRARTRLSTFFAGFFLMVLLVAVGDVVGRIPMAVLVGIMIMVSVGTMDWRSIHPRTLRLMPLSETAVMAVTIIATVATNNLAIGVILGVVTAMIAFARRVAHLTTVEKVSEIDADGDGVIDVRRYRVTGELFWASSNDLVYQFDYADDPERVIIDLTDADVWDASTVATLDAVLGKYAQRGKTAKIIGLDGASLQRLKRLTGRLD